MSTTQIPPGRSVPPPPATRPEASELYDAARWETAYREMHDVPALLIQLQDDLARARKREAFWISVIVHLAMVIVIVNSDRLLRLFPRRSVIMVSPSDQIRQKDLTYLELPPDEQKLTRKPDTNVISDKNRIATSKSPHVDPKELKKILDSARAGRPGQGGQPAPPPQPQQQAQNAPPQPPQEQPEQAPPAPPPPTNTNQMAKLTTPPITPPKPSFNTAPMSAGSAIEQAARAALANRGAGYGSEGEGGDYGLGQGRQATKAVGELDVLSDTMGVDFGPYLSRVLQNVRQNWYNLIPEVARAPIMKKGKVSIEFAIMKDGSVQGLRYVGSSGDVALDRAAYGGITASNPFPPLPGEFKGQYLALRFHFFYNPDRTDLQ
ncbi:MAG TPA: TonB family protein [Terriglobales bacterium]|nr:TonB family protein [Terriglobales bacterium]